MAQLYDFSGAFDSLSAFISTHDMGRDLVGDVSQGDKLAQIINAIATINDNINKVQQRLSEVEKSLKPITTQQQTAANTSAHRHAIPRGHTHSWFDAGERMMKMMEEEKDNQRRAVDQIEDRFEEKRPW